MKLTKKLEEFNDVFDIHYPKSPSIGDDKLRSLRHNLMHEEMSEYLEAEEAYYDSINEDEDQKEELFLVDIADSLGDQLYILIGTFVAHGMGDKVSDIFNEIHRSNMTKICASKEEAEETLKHHYKRKNEEGYITNKSVGGKDFFICRRKGDGKIIKSINYSEPNLLEIIRKK